ncbi:hypothetical protein BJX64DRAFT_176851 [Aspergillus heterothallicus]
MYLSSVHEPTVDSRFALVELIARQHNSSLITLAAIILIFLPHFCIDVGIVSTLPGTANRNLSLSALEGLLNNNHLFIFHDSMEVARNYFQRHHVILWFIFPKYTHQQRLVPPLFALLSLGP